MRFIFLLILLYFAFKAAGNLLEAVQSDGESRRQIDRTPRGESDIEDARWEDIE